MADICYISSEKRRLSPNDTVLLVAVLCAVLCGVYLAWFGFNDPINVGPNGIRWYSNTSTAVFLHNHMANTNSHGVTHTSFYKHTKSQCLHAEFHSRTHKLHIYKPIFDEPEVKLKLPVGIEITPLTENTEKFHL